MKIAHILRRFTFSEWGGTENVVWNSVLTQRQLGQDAEIFCTAALSSPGTEVKEGVTIHRFPYWYPYFPMPDSTKGALDKKGGNPFVPKLFKSLAAGQFDLFHVHAGGRMAVQSLLLARKLGIPCIMSLHGGHIDVPKKELENMMAPIKGKFHYGGILDRLMGLHMDAVAGMDAIICIGRQEEKLLNEKYPGRRIIYLPNGIDCDKFTRHYDISPRKEWNIPENRKLILCISRIDYQKNQKLLVELLKNTNDTHVLLIGPVTSEWYKDEILKEVSSNNLNDRFTLIPGLPPDDPRLVQIMHEADAFILPSVHEPFGIVILEAWASGIPVIASNAGGLKDLIKSEVNGLNFPPDDPNALIQAWKKLDSSSELRTSLIENALQEVRNFTWPALMKRLMSEPFFKNTDH